MQVGGGRLPQLGALLIGDGAAELAEVVLVRVRVKVRVRVNVRIRVRVRVGVRIGVRVRVRVGVRVRVRPRLSSASLIWRLFSFLLQPRCCAISSATRGIACLVRVMLRVRGRLRGKVRVRRG